MSETQPKRWFAVDVEVDAAAAEAVEYAFNTLEALGTEIDHLRKTGTDAVKITGYFNDLPTGEDLRFEINDALNVYGQNQTAIRSTSTREVEDADWLAEWKRHWKPTEIGKFIIAPPWSEVAETEKIIIRIEPNMAFGTGTHDTTQLCLNAIGEQYAPEMSVLDVGTGTGILAIAVAKLGGTNIFACDTDADSIKIARENAILNGVGDAITFADGPIDDSTPQYDFTCANLTADVIVPILPLLIEKTKNILLLSGILAEQEKLITDELLKFQISNFQIEHSGEWISVLIKS
ncbi:MAG TPA: 50S ribosomal protein L11 methyltransferase [Pyrinomonadaceae bacterium]|nr:50S ribosomal protein L11 methyltransferase [Pyrinomonadaceae bacterium]